MNENLDTSTSHEGKKKKSYSIKRKLDIVQAAGESSISEAARKFNVDRRSVAEWVKTKDKLVETKGCRARLEGGGRKVLL